MLSVDEDAALELRSTDGRTVTSFTTTGSDIVQTVLRLRGSSGSEVNTPARSTHFDGEGACLPPVPPLTPMASPQKSCVLPFFVPVLAVLT